MLPNLHARGGEHSSLARPSHMLQYILTATARSRSFRAAALGASNLRFSLHVTSNLSLETLKPQVEEGYIRANESYLTYILQLY